MLYVDPRDIIFQDYFVHIAYDQQSSASACKTNHINPVSGAYIALFNTVCNVGSKVRLPTLVCQRNAIGGSFRQLSRDPELQNYSSSVCSVNCVEEGRYSRHNL